MAKKSFICSECQAVHPQWTGQCKSCNAWNTLVETLVEKQNKKKHPTTASLAPILLQNIQNQDQYRIPVSDSEVNRVLGGGLVPGGIVLLGGEPGIGKSTLLLQIATQAKYKVLYASGEESLNQIKMRADRLGVANAQCYLIADNDIDNIVKQCKTIQPNLIIIDSVQTVFTRSIDSAQGTVSQIRECTHLIQQYCKAEDIPCIIIGHITKEGSLAGPKILEHLVDTVLQFEGDKNYHHRILRAHKNRFGSTDEIGIFEMVEKGLVKVEDPSQLLLSQSLDELSGSAICSTIHGVRPLLIETQALISSSTYGNPQRSSTGYDTKRLNMLLAVLEKRIGLSFGQYDVFLNIAGGLRCHDPAIDLSIFAALVSSYRDYAINKSVAFAGEIGLTGEIRAVYRLEERIKEAERMGITHFYTSKHSLDNGDFSFASLELVGLSRVEELTHLLFE